VAQLDLSHMSYPWFAARQVTNLVNLYKWLQLHDTLIREESFFFTKSGKGNCYTNALGRDLRVAIFLGRQVTPLLALFE